MGRADRTWSWRAAGGFAVLWLVGGLAVVWLLFGARLAALSGIAGPTGTFVVTGCFEGPEDTSTDCRGTYTPSSASSSADATAARPMLLRSASSDLRPGTRRDVRLVGDTVFEPSPLAAAEYVTFAGWTAVTLGLPGHWLLTSARRGRLRNREGHVLVWLASLLGAIALGILALPVAWLLGRPFEGRRGREFTRRSDV
ncbi:hypothetical protein PV726_49940 [Streptomyces europaeiscabiei]|uniref:hypothetical protein n=1 Tax=Streptomyces europaeiscabiei TaxID=146819 RepID=UPI0029B95020|nr:hypothetical protein [Streptomyces europaeiscabiei]MDX3698115.1 hypothetical protein [Streptomyces europaeiscabiei]